ncbi:Small-conductance mechanosensitive channel [Micromonospora purpureochromogenes]|uniref:Small-conductance mechanosensitive channel n=1 Tax=Micromonospora purpureochromogenes TaxID=47872 RepID=A0A1C4ZRG5_9ACTN|nr:mechanosensitive ion channel domain-containing protein [Micromonospora purpureochromogenes]SCF35565.1 Small-conductance mechanosensitive channel [Micromonospora purpureochromogenes]
MRTALIVLAALTAAVVVDLVSGVLIRRAARGRYKWLLEPLRHACRRPAAAALLVGALYYALPLGPAEWQRYLRHAILLVLIAIGAWLVIKALSVVEAVAFSRLPSDLVTSRRVRRARTQIRPVRRLTVAVVTVAAIGLILITFRPVRLAGISILTSAGVVGAVIGLSARTALGNAFAGIQIAFADGMHVGDVLVVDGEWGRVEEVKLTNVVIRLWDDRVLILPTTYFTERPFQNWTRNESRVIGKIQIHVDHTADLNDLRREARRLVESSPLWDRDRWVLQMVDATPQTVVIQVQASAADGASAWDLRCDLREGLIRYLRDQHPQWLPRTRSQYQP